MASAAEKPDLHANSPTSPMTPDLKTRPTEHADPVEDDLELRLTRAQTFDKKIKHRVRILRVIQRTGSTIASVLVLGVMLNTYMIFQHHKTANVNGSVIQVYPSQPILWPTYMMIATSTISLAFSFATLMAYCIDACTGAKDRVMKANYVDSWHTRVGYLISATNFVVWLATSTTFKMMQGDANSNPPPRDLFGYSCSNFVDALTAQFHNAIPNFDTQCKTQQASFGIGVINAFLELLGLVVNILAVRRMIVKRQVARLESRSSGAKL